MFMNYFVDEFFCTGPFLELLLDVELPVLFRFSFVFLCVLYILIFVHSFLGGLHLTAISAIFLITKKNSFFFFWSMSVPSLQFYVLIQQGQFLLLSLWKYFFIYLCYLFFFPQYFSHWISSFSSKFFVFIFHTSDFP